MAAISASDIERSFFQRFNFTKTVDPVGISLPRFLSGPALLECLPKSFKYVYNAPETMKTTDIYQIVYDFVVKYPDNPELTQILFPIFCYVIVLCVKDGVSEEHINAFATRHLSTIPENERPEAELFIKDGAKFSRLASLFCTLQYKLNISDKTHQLIVDFLNKTNTKVISLFAELFRVTKTVHSELPIDSISKRFISSIPENLTLISGKISNASHAAPSPCKSEVFIARTTGSIECLDFENNFVTKIFHHAFPVTSMSLSSTGNVLLTTDMRSTVHVRSPSASSEFHAGMYPVWCSAFAPVGGVFALGLGSGSIDLYETAKMTKIRCFAAEAEPIVDVKFHPNCGYVGSARGGVLRLWDLRDAECARVFQLKKYGFPVLSFSPNGAMIGCFDGDGTVYDIGTGELVVRRACSSSNAASVHFTEDSRHLCVVGARGEVSLMDLSGDDVCMRTVANLDAKVVSVALERAEMKVITSC